MFRRNKVNLFLHFSLIFFLLSSCSSSRVEDEDISQDMSKEYKIKDASSKIRPGWISSAFLWAKKEEPDHEQKIYRYFSYETTPKVDREMACSLARMNVKYDIASEITSFIDANLAQSKEGQSDGEEGGSEYFSGVREYVQQNLGSKVRALIHGVEIRGMHWEKRHYRKELEAKRNYTAYTCAVYARMRKSQLKKAIQDAVLYVSRQLNDNESREKVAKILENVENRFLEMRGGE